MTKAIKPLSKTGLQTKIKRATRKAKTYQQKYTIAVRVGGEEVKQNIEDIRERYGLRNYTPKQLRKLDKVTKKAYYKTNYQIATGYYEKKRNKQWEDNYIKVMALSGVDPEVIQEFINTIKNRKVSIKQLSAELDKIQMWYPSKHDMGKDDNTTFTKDMIKKIRKGNFDYVSREKSKYISERENVIKEDLTRLKR